MAAAMMMEQQQQHAGQQYQEQEGDVEVGVTAVLLFGVHGNSESLRLSVDCVSSPSSLTPPPMFHVSFITLPLR